MVKKMVNEKQEQGWQFLFLGANIDAVKEAEKIGVHRTHAASYKNDSKGVQLNFSAVGNVVSYMRGNEFFEDDVEAMIPQFLKPIAEHLEEDE